MKDLDSNNDLFPSRQGSGGHVTASDMVLAGHESGMDDESCGFRFLFHTCRTVNS